MSKFVGKFRKDEEYFDEYKTLNEKKQHLNRKENKKTLFRNIQKSYELNELEEYDVIYK